MHINENNYAFIDSQNLNLGVRSLGWKINFKSFRDYLLGKYNIQKAFLFIGYIDGNSNLYKALQGAGFICIFKPTLYHANGRTKGNCDAELVLQTMIEYGNYNKALIVTGDGDFYCLVKYLIQHDKLKKLLIPNHKKYSALLKKFPSEYLASVNDLKDRIMYEKNPIRTNP
ncbi:MAG: NYN domain-containing protein [Candidatus Gracilibacteria bacterium]|jgi:uncharacterized LabA/DUF88 family protein